MDGTIDLASGMAGNRSRVGHALAQIAAEELGISIKDVNVITGDTCHPTVFGGWGVGSFLLQEMRLRCSGRDKAEAL